MSLFDDLSPASYKGLNFLVVSGSLSGGRKEVKHSFPNKDTQVIEDLGRSPRTYSLEIVISGEDYIQSRDNLIRVFEEGGPGPLVHPFYGRIEDMVARPYTLVENMSSVGVGRITVVFEPTLSTGIPQASLNTLNNIAVKNDAVQVSIKGDIQDDFNVTESFTGNFSAAVDLLNGVVDSFNDNTSFLQASADQIDSYTRGLSDFEANIFTLIQAPRNLADSIGNLFISIDNLYPTVGATAAVLTGFFGFGDDDVLQDITTAGRVERNANTQVINSSMQAMSLGFAYLNTVQVDFETTFEIEAAADSLEAQYQKVIDSRGLSDETKSMLVDLRLAAQAFFIAEKLTARRVIAINTPLTSARLLSYKLYGRSKDGRRIVGLNSAPDVSFIEGPIKVLTA